MATQYVRMSVGVVRFLFKDRLTVCVSYGHLSMFSGSATYESERLLILAPGVMLLSRLPLLCQFRGESVEWRRREGSMRYIRERPLSPAPCSNTQPSSFNSPNPTPTHSVLHQFILGPIFCFRKTKVTHQ